jgi:predicted Co/Zn/Cd cation transporter (cation efflux family)
VSLNGVFSLISAVSGVFVLLMCVYGVLNGVEGVRNGGHPTDAEGVIGYALATAAFCVGFGAWEWRLGCRIGSSLRLDDAKEWLMDAALSAVTLLGFAVLPLLPEPQRVDGLVQRVEQVLARLCAEHDIARAKHHVVRTGRIVFVDIDFVVGPAFTLQRVAQQDALCEQIRAAIGRSLDEARLTVCFTEDRRWT